MVKADSDSPAAAVTSAAGAGLHSGLDATLARELARLLAGLRFGSVEIVVHDGAITQVERRERLRLTGVPFRRA
ncbi:MAG: YezD family protein [Betaproteobacteria bacterium]|jgi:hypothetical protein|nr:YezD family protein [Rhodocyclaceae bacterium]MCA3133669.1 YezD family protein [Rhodocyclaceae bacterium]MCA3142990.1 YezD family protein [Rhodocyclaceae bacterium]MCA3144097.1 YezD family protein [Rhodocyclaceae bacterium]MCE2899400.1 YezD family protein [Betaproteobacteria bacterium]